MYILKVVSLDCKLLSEMLCGPPMDNDTTRGRGFFLWKSRLSLVTCSPLWSSEALSNMSNLRGFCLEIRPIWGINYLTRHLPLAKEDKVTFTIIFQ